jgi:hypothetical protein
MPIDISGFRNTPYLRGFIFSRQMYTVWKRVTIPAAQTKYIQMTTPDDRYIHGVSRILIPNSGASEVYMYEAPTITTPGTATLDVINLNRNSAKTSSCVFKTDPVISGGTMIEEVFLPGNLATSYYASHGTNMRVDIETEYKLDTEYAMSFYNNSGDAMYIFWQFTFYESGN